MRRACLCMIIVSLTCTGATTTIGNLVFTTIDDSTAGVRAVSTDISGDIKIPSSVNIDGKEYTVTTVEDRAFASCQGVTSVDLPESIKTLGTRSFSKCGITSIEFHNGLVSIGEEAFASESSGAIVEVDIPSTVTDIGLRAFYNTQIEILNIRGDASSPVLTIGEDAFGGTRNKMTSIRVARKDPPVLESGAFRKSDMTVPVVLYGPAATQLDAYKSADGWKDMNLTVEAPTALSQFETDNSEMTPTEIYTITGRRVDTRPQYLTKGIYIVRSANETKKIIID